MILHYAVGIHGIFKGNFQCPFLNTTNHFINDPILMVNENRYNIPLIHNRKDYVVGIFKL